MNFELTEEHLMIQSAARDFAQNELLPGVIERDEHQTFPKEQIRKMGELGFLGMMVDLLAGIPSIVYGLWGFYVLRPFLIDLGLPNQGFGIFTASIILAIMIIPYATSISNEIIMMVPNELKEAAYSLGATKSEVIFNVVVPSARSGIMAGYILSFGRAIPLVFSLVHSGVQQPLCFSEHSGH